MTLEEAEFETLRKSEDFCYYSLNFFNKYTGKIEIIRDNTKETIYFPVLPYAEALQMQQKDMWLEKLPVGRPKEKLDFFMNDTLDFGTYLRKDYSFAKVFRYTPVFGALAKQITLWKSLVFCLVI